MNRQTRDVDVQIAVVKPPGFRLIALSLGAVFALALALVAAAAPASASAAAAGVASASGPAPSGPAGLQWGSCPEREGWPHDPRQQCALLSVPLDYAKPRGRHIDIAVSRIPAARPDLRRGVLVFNSGGPGNEGLNVPSDYAPADGGQGNVCPGCVHVPNAVTDRYDLVGFDPRGIGRSAPVTCGFTPEQIALARPWPQPGGIPKAAAIARGLVDDCFRHSGATLPYITTVNTARDLDAIRSALGERRISCICQSVGTYLAAVYSSLFPSHVDRLVLDSSVDPTRIWRGVIQRQGPAFEARFEQFGAFAAAANATYGLGDTPAAVRRTYFAVVERLDSSPATVNGVLRTGNGVRNTMRLSMYEDASFPGFAKLLHDLVAAPSSAVSARSSGAGSASAVAALISPDIGGFPRAATAAARSTSSAAESDYPAVPSDNYFAANFAVWCGDTAWPRSLDVYERDVRRDGRQYPLVGATVSNVWACTYWPNPRERLVPILGKGPRNMLLIHNTVDPSTPLAGALEMRKALGERARMVTVDAGGHGSYLFVKNACGDNIVNDFLVTGKLPNADRFCPKAPTAAKR